LLQGSHNAPRNHGSSASARSSRRSILSRRARCR
jgi:hypothetical protein